MKKVLLLVAVLVIVPALGWTAALNCNQGEYKGNFWSVSKDLNGKNGTLTVKKEGEKCVMNFKAEGGTEVWELSGNTLIQKELDNTGKVAQQYGATLQGDKYVINCKDKAKNDCDAGSDSRSYWLLNNTPDGGYKYVVYGVGPENKGKPDASVVKRHDFTFLKTTPK